MTQIICSSKDAVSIKEDQAMEGSPEEKEKEDNQKQVQDIDNQKETMMSAELEMDQEMTRSEMEQEDQELQEIFDKEHLDLEGFLIQRTMGGVDSVSQEELNRIQQWFLWKSLAKGFEKGKNNTKQDNKGVKMMKTTPTLATRNFRKKRGRKSNRSS